MKTLWTALLGFICALLSEAQDDQSRLSSDGIVCILGSENLRHAGTVRAIAFSADGKLLISGGSDKTLRIWDSVSGKLVKMLRFEEPITCIDVSKDGRTAVAAGMKIHLYESADAKELSKLDAHDDEITSLAFSPDGKTLVSSSKDKTIRFWDTESGRLEHRCDQEQRVVLSVAWDPGGKSVASTQDDNTIRLWNPETGRELQQLEGVSATLETIAFSPNGNLLAYGGSDRLVHVFDLSSKKESRQISTKSSINRLVFFPHGERIAFSSADSIRILDLSKEQDICTIRADAVSVYAISLSPDGKTLASGGKDGVVRLWDTTTGMPTIETPGHQQCVSAVLFSLNGKQLITTSYDSTIRVWSIPDGAELAVLKGHQDGISSLVLSRDGKWVVTGSHDGSVRIWDFASKREIQKLDAQLDGVSCVAISCNSKLIATGGRDSSIRIWDTTSWSQSHSLGGHEAEVSCIAFSDDEQLLVSGSHDGTVRIWDLKSGTELRNIGKHDSYVRSVGFFPGSKLIVSSGEDGTVRLWTLDSDKPLLKLDAGKGSARAMAISPDRRMFAITRQYQITLWELATQKECFTMRGEFGIVTSLSFSPDGCYLVAGYANGIARLWNLAPKGDFSFEGAWEKFVGDPRTAYRAGITISELADDGFGFLKEKLRECCMPAEQVEKLISDLESDQAEVRDGAFQKLAGLDIGSTLKTSLDKLENSAELKERIKNLLVILDSGQLATKEMIRWHRIVQNLERIAAKTKSPQSVAALREIATSCAWKRIKKEASDSLNRLGHERTSK